MELTMSVKSKRVQRISENCRAILLKKRRLTSKLCSSDEVEPWNIFVSELLFYDGYDYFNFSAAHSAISGWGKM